MGDGTLVKRLGISLGLMLVSTSAAAQEVEDFAITVKKTSSGAVLDYRIGVDGSLVSEDYFLTRLTCRKGDKSLDVMLPISREDAVGQDGSTLRQEGNTWHLTIKAGKRQFDKVVTFVPLTDKASQLKEGVVIRLTHGDVEWKALIDPRGDQLVALTGGFGEYEGVPDDAHLRQFERHCGLKR